MIDPFLAKCTLHYPLQMSSYSDIWNRLRCVAGTAPSLVTLKEVAIRGAITGFQIVGNVNDL